MKIAQTVLAGTFLVVLTMVLTMSSAAALYRWVDAQGQVHYSDTPHPGAEEIVLRKSNVVRSFKPAQEAPAAVGTSDEEGDAFTGYTGLQVTSPAADQTLWNIGGQLPVSVAVQPALQKGHGIVVFLDGRPVDKKPQASTSFLIQNVYRGTHTVRASVYSDTGKVLYNSPSVTFFVQQNSAN